MLFHGMFGGTVAGFSESQVGKKSGKEREQITRAQEIGVDWELESYGD